MNPAVPRPYSAHHAPDSLFDAVSALHGGGGGGRSASARRQATTQSYASVNTSTSSPSGNYVSWRQQRGRPSSSARQGRRGGGGYGYVPVPIPVPIVYDTYTEPTYVETPVYTEVPVYADPYADPYGTAEPVYVPEGAFTDEWGNPVMGVGRTVSAASHPGIRAGQMLAARIKGSRVTVMATDVLVTVPTSTGLSNLMRLAADVGRSNGVAAYVDTTGASPTVRFSLAKQTNIAYGTRQRVSPGVVRVAGTEERAQRLATKLAEFVAEQRITPYAPEVIATALPHGRQGYAVLVPGSEYVMRAVRQHADRLLTAHPNLYLSTVPSQHGYVAFVFGDDPSGGFTTGKLPTGRRAIPFDFYRDLDDINNYYATSGYPMPMHTAGTLPHRPYTFDVNLPLADQRAGLDGQYWTEVHDFRSGKLPHRPYTFDFDRAQADQRTSLNGQYWTNVHNYRAGAVTAPPAYDLSVASDCAQSFAAEAAQAGLNPGIPFSLPDGSAVVVPLAPNTNARAKLAHVRTVLAANQECPAGLTLGEDAVFAWFGAPGMTPAVASAGIEGVESGRLPHRPYTFDFDRAQADQRTSLNGQYWDVVHNYRG